MNIIQPKMERFIEEIYFHLKNYYFTKKILRNANFYFFLKNKFILFLIYISFYNFLQF